jgi:hypothetical protein
MPSLEEEHGIGVLRKAYGHHLFYPVDDPVVDKLDLVGDDAVLEDPVDSLPRGSDVVIDGNDRLFRRRQGVELELGFRDAAQPGDRAGAHVRASPARGRGIFSLFAILTKEATWPALVGKSTTSGSRIQFVVPP